MIVMLRCYSEKLCRKGLLERGLRSGLLIRNFKSIENEFMTSLACYEEDPGLLLTSLVKAKNESVSKELTLLKSSLENLKTTIGNLRIEVKSKVEKRIYEKWTEHVNAQSTKFTQVFSKSNDFHYKVAEEENKEMSNLYYNISHFATNTTFPYEENIKKKRQIEAEAEELNEMFSDETNPFDVGTFENQKEKQGVDGTSKAAVKRTPLATIIENPRAVAKKSRWD